MIIRRDTIDVQCLYHTGNLIRLLENFDDTFSNIDHRSIEAHGLVAMGFEWDSCEQGYDYWFLVHQKCKRLWLETR